MDWCRGTVLVCRALVCRTVVGWTICAGGWTKPVAAYPAPVDFNGKILRWSISLEQPDITYKVVFKGLPIDPNLLAIVDESANLWNGARESYANLLALEADEQPKVRITFQRTLDGAPHSSGYSIFSRGDDGNPTGCEIFIATQSGSSYSGKAKTVLHEFGHCLGLGHSLIGEAIMSYELDKNHFALDLDDEAALALLYPADGTAPALPIGCSIGHQRWVQPWSTPLCFGLLCLPLILITSGLYCKGRENMKLNNL